MSELRALAPCPRPPASPDRLEWMQRPAWSIAGAMAMALAGCGGGGSNGTFFPLPAPTPAPAPAPAPAQATISGVAASGSAFAGARITIVDKNGATVCDTTTDALGSYTCTLPATASFPVVVTASREDQVLYSVSATASGGRVNVTPLTTIVVSRLSPAGDPAQLAAALSASTVTLDEAAIKAKVDEVIALLKPLLDALGDTVDPITGTFAANGTGHDRTLDSIAVSVRPDGTAANIEITLQLIPTSGTVQPVSVTFRSSDATLPAGPAVNVAQLAAPGVGTAIGSLLDRMTACFALPLSQRVNAPSDTAAVTGGPSNVIAPACRTLFANNDPATYLSGGNRVGRDALGNGSFSGLFRPGTTGAVFNQGELGFYRSNGDVVLRYRSLDLAGNEVNDVLVARYEGADLKLIGNQYVYNASVRASYELRDFVNSPAISYYATGYNLFVANVNGSNGLPLFSKVQVTSPGGKVYTLVPTAGNSYLGILNQNNVISSVTSILRVAASYRDRGTAGNPIDREPTLFPDPVQLTDDQIVHLLDQGVWTMEFFHADIATPNVIQSYRTHKRALTPGEARQKTYAELTPAMRSLLVSLTSSARTFTFGPPSASAPNNLDFSAGGQDAWSVPTQAVAPTLFSIFGRAPNVGGTLGTRFNDDANLASTARTARVVCSPQTVADPHCDTSTGVTQYAQGSNFNTVQLFGRDSTQSEAFSTFAFYVPVN
jgi:hypothetical protein